MALGGGRRGFGFAVALSASVVILAAGLPTGGAAAAALPVVKVSPSKGLVDLQNVTVTGSGFSPNVQIGTVECRPGAVGQADCNLGTLVYARSDQHGKFTLKRYVRRLLSVGGKTIDCAAAKGCILGAGNVGNLKQANGQKIFFNPKVPPKVAKITVAPNTKLVDHQLVTVSGKGYAPGTTVYISQCITHPPSRTGQVCDYATERYATVGTDGTFLAVNFVLERRQVMFTKNNSRTIVDCAHAANTCDIQTSPSGLGSSIPAKAPLAFDPNVNAAVAAVQLSPLSPLQDLEAVTLTGSGFTPGYAVNVQECAVGTTKIPSCDYTTNRAVTAGLHGAFTLTYYVRRDIAPTGTTSIDCATAAGTCELLLQGTQSQAPLRRLLTFDPNSPAVPPAIAASPNTGLADNQRITVSIGGFTPFEPVQIIECSADAVSESNLGYCDYNTGQTVTPTGPGTLQTGFDVRAVISGQAGPVDCTTQSGACILVATGYGGYSGAPGSTIANLASTDLTFGP